MESTNRKAEQSQVTRAALLRVARNLFGERGYNGASREEVVARAGVTRGALQYHFGRKEDLFRAVFDDEERTVGLKVAATAFAYDDPWERLKAGCQAFLDACQDPAMQRIMLWDAPAVLGEAVCHDTNPQHSYGMMRAGLRAAIYSDTITDGALDALARMVYGAINEAAMLITNADEVQTTRDDAGAAIELLLNGLRISTQKSPG